MDKRWNHRWSRREALAGLGAAAGMGFLGLGATPAAAEPPPETAGPETFIIIAKSTDWRFLRELREELKA